MEGFGHADGDERETLLEFALIGLSDRRVASAVVGHDDEHGPVEVPVGVHVLEKGQEFVVAVGKSIVRVVRVLRVKDERELRLIGIHVEQIAYPIEH